MSDTELSVKNLDVSQLKPNKWNTNVVTPENEAKIKESISRFGLFKPILTRNSNDGLQEIIGGEHRWQVAKKMGYSSVPVISLGDVDDKTAKEISLVDNGRYGEDDGLQLSELLKSIGTVEEISSFLPYSGSEMEDLFKQTESINFDELELGLNKEDEFEVPEVLKTKPPKTHVMMRFNIPIDDFENVRTRIEDVIRTNNFTADDSLTNAGNALVYILLGGDK